MSEDGAPALKWRCPLARYRERHDGIAVGSRLALYLTEKFAFQIVCLKMKFAGRDLLWSSAAKAQFANPKSIVGTHWRPEYTTRHRPCAVEVALPGVGIQCRAGFFVGEIFKCLFNLVKNAGGRVSWKVGTETGASLSSAPLHLFCAFRIMFLQFSQTLLKPERVKLADSKNTDAALGTSRAARESASAASAI
jgi:hypothetical protein